ncbi:MAG: glycoside hydrolase family 78 protein [Planctomycetes bacterium]|nr:glycoside hydrolase family 78 protein [Planctomycetota bacterium]
MRHSFDRWHRVLFRACAATLLLAGGVRAAVRPVNLVCEYRTNPLGIDVREPRLSWMLESAERGERQTAYRIRVASSAAKLGAGEADLWDSGRVETDRSIHVPYAGEPLASRVRCHWTVEVWGADGASATSAPAWWEMGLLAKDDWKGAWISAPPPKDGAGTAPAPFFRKAFELAGAPRRARLYIAGLGYHEVHINGKRVGDHVLDPAFTRYDRRCLYVTHDVTGLLAGGRNAIGVILGNGWYNPHATDVWDFHKSPWRDRPVLRCQLEVQSADGSVRTIASDATWKVSTGPILFDSIRNGETYDARLELPGWATAAFDDASWAAPVAVAGPKGILSAQNGPPIEVMETIVPVKVTEPKPGIFLFDLGQNIAGWARLTAAGPAGTKVVLRYGERLLPDGSLDQKDIGPYVKQHAFQTDTYILKGLGTEIWEPRFVYHGFQYVEVAGFPGTPTLDSLRGRVVYTSFPRAGSFACSNELLNRIQKATLWSYVGNFHGYPTDCPHREKNGWTGDAHLASEQGLLNFAPAAAYTKWMDDMKDEQRESGELPGIVPTSGWGYAWGNGPAWDSAYVLIPWYLYRYCGDTRILAAHYDHLKRYVDYLTGKSKDHIVAIGLGDWVPAKTKTPEKVTSTGYYYRDARIVSEIAKLIGKADDAKTYGDLADAIAKAFHREFFDAKSGLYAGGTQTAMSCALYHGLVPAEERERVVANLVANIRSQGGHLDAGILGTKYLIDALTENGRADLVYGMATKTDFPSWGRWLAQGATTLWEEWQGGGSRNHIMFGHISAWFYAALAGIAPDPEGPGFERIIIRPQPVGDLTWARAEHVSLFGPIRSAWRKEGDTFRLDVTIPPNSTATVHVPAKGAPDVTEGGKPASDAAGVRFLRMEDGCAVFAVASGSYAFSAR